MRRTNLRASVISALLIASTAQAPAGDTANLDILGFSADGSIFAFEEYGIQDGSGFPYANRYYIDTATDSFVAGSPIRVRSEEDGADLVQARQNVSAKGEAFVEDAELKAHSGFTAGYHSLAQVGGDPHQMTLRPRAIFPPIDEPITISLVEQMFPALESCSGLSDEVSGFTLKMRIGDAESRLLYQDKSVPESRICPLGYSIQAVQTFYPKQGNPVFAVIIAVRRVGFEGPDHRFIAVTGKL